MLSQTAVRSNTLSHPPILMRAAVRPIAESSNSKPGGCRLA